MNENVKLNLIDGNFSDEEAREILMAIFSSKINFHELKNFSSQDRFGKNDAIAQKRIGELKISLEIIKEMIAEAKKTNKRLIISSDINLKLSDSL
jgi:hypothetical protein